MWVSCNGGGGEVLLLRGLVSVGQVAAVGEVETHKTVMGLHDCLVDLEVCGGP